MKRILTAVLGLALAGLAMAQEHKVIEKSFKPYGSIRIKTVSGDVNLIKASGKNIKVKVEYRVEPEGAFTPEFRERGQSLRLSEHWSGRSCNGDVLWTVEVPENVNVKYSTASGSMNVSDLEIELNVSTASGDIELDDVAGEFDINTASGSIRLDGGKGEFDLSTASGGIEIDNATGIFQCSVASGDIDIRDVEGEVECSTASGDIEGSGIKFNTPASFSAASGDIDVKLNGPLKYDLSLSTASGAVTLDFNGQSMKGLFEMTARVHRGRIIAPFEFDTEERFEQYDQEYIRKTAKIQSGEPHIEISTASGRAAVLK